MRHVISGEIVELKLEEFLALFDESIHTNILELTKHYPDAQGLVCFENIQLDSSERGMRTASVFGPSNTYNEGNLSDVRLGNLPSNFRYPRYICRI